MFVCIFIAQQYLYCCSICPLLMKKKKKIQLQSYICLKHKYIFLSTLWHSYTQSIIHTTFIIQCIFPYFVLRKYWQISILWLILTFLTRKKPCNFGFSKLFTQFTKKKHCKSVFLFSHSHIYLTHIYIYIYIYIYINREREEREREVGERFRIALKPMGKVSIHLICL